MRKLISVLLSFVILCSVFPAAFADSLIRGANGVRGFADGVIFGQQTTDNGQQNF